MGIISSIGKKIFTVIPFETFETNHFISFESIGVNQLREHKKELKVTWSQYSDKIVMTIEGNSLSFRVKAIKQESSGSFWELRVQPDDDIKTGVHLIQFDTYEKKVILFTTKSTDSYLA